MGEADNSPKEEIGKLTFDAKKAAPPGWGDDHLSKFLGAAHQNSWATFHNLKAECNRLRTVDDIFRKAGDHLDNAVDQIVPCLMLFRSHSAYLSGAGLAMNCQLRESYPVLRACLEDAIYAYHMHKDPSTSQIWLKRDADEVTRKAMRVAFKLRPILDGLVADDPRIGNAVAALYERVIDYGAHPNEKGVFSNLQIRRTKEAYRLDSLYFNADDLALKLALKTAAQVGVGALLVFRRIFQTRFDLVGLSGEIDSAGHGL